MNNLLQYSELVELTTEELFEELGSILSGSSFGFADEDPDKFRRSGKEWFEQNLTRIRSKICGNPKIEPLLSGTGSDAALTVFAAVSEAVAGLSGSQQATAVLTVLIVRYGVKRLCADGVGNKD